MGTVNDADDADRAFAGSAGLSVAGVAAGGVAGVGFLVEPVNVPMWFPMAAIVLPTGDVLKVMRRAIGRFDPAQKSDQ